MKKRILILSLCAILCLGCLTVFAENGGTGSTNNGIDVSWNGDYEAMEFEIKIKSNLPYTQQTSILVYDANLADYTFENFSRVFEVTIQSNSEKTIVFPITNDFVSSNNKYVIKVQASGYMAGSANDDLFAWIIPPSDINGEGGVLTTLNNANINTIEAAITSVKDALEISFPANVDRNTLLSTFLSSRASDYENGKFQNLNDVRSSWNGACVIAYLKGNSIVLNDLIAMTEQNKESFNLDVENNDYVNNKSDIYELIVSYANGNREKLVGCKKLESLLQEFQVVACINNSTVDNISGYIDTYYHTFGKDISYYNQYSAFIQGQKDIVNRQLYNKNYTSLSTLADNFVNAVTVVYNGNGSSGNLNEGGGIVGGGGDFGSPSIPAGTGGVSAPVTKSDFTDCPPTYWAYSYIEKLRDKGVVSGYSDGAFYPENSVSREEFIKMLVSAVGLYDNQAECNFNDVKTGDWYYKYVASAYNNGIINGVDESNFGVGVSITREDVAVIIYRTMEKLGKNKGQNILGEATDFTDFDDVSSYAQDGVTVLSQSQVINGFEDGTFRPKAYLTRAQASKIIVKVCELIG